MIISSVQHIFGAYGAICVQICVKFGLSPLKFIITSLIKLKKKNCSNFKIN